MYFDSHCHLDRIDLTDFDQSFDVLVAKTKQQNVNQMLCISVDLDSYPSMQEKIKNYPNIYASVGVHPDYKDAKEPTIEQLVKESKAKNVVAIGETGLDYIQPKGESDDFKWQRERFVTHIEAAKLAQLPLIIHTRDAQKDTIDLLTSNRADSVGGVMHCFTEDWAMAKQAIELDFYISISGIVTFNQAKNVHEMAKKIPDDRLLIETDSPWLAPAPYRGKTNFPGWVTLVAKRLAELRNTSIEHIAEISRNNAEQLFRITP